MPSSQCFIFVDCLGFIVAIYRKVVSSRSCLTMLQTIVLFFIFKNNLLFHNFVQGGRKMRNQRHSTWGWPASLIPSGWCISSISANTKIYFPIWSYNLHIIIHMWERSSELYITAFLYRFLTPNITSCSNWDPWKGCNVDICKFSVNSKASNQSCPLSHILFLIHTINKVTND